MNKVVFILVVVVVGIVCFGWLSFQKKSAEQPGQGACTQEAKFCPDGSYVSRSGPTCEFAACPNPTPTSDGWETSTDSTTGVSFPYPPKLITEYIHTVDWPPKVQVLNQPFACIEVGTETTSMRINNTWYCVTKKTEGAAGSSYTNYAYAFSKDDKTVILTFSLQAVQCDNYDDQKKTACQQEQSGFNFDRVADRMAQRLQFQ